jgi:molybdopterin synthase catalytic subunit
MKLKKDDVVEYVNNNEDLALEKTSRILKREIGMQSFNGIIGGKNATYGVELLEYETAEGYVDAWMKSHQKRYNNEKNLSYSRSSHRVHDLLQDSFVKRFVENYLARTYFNKQDKSNK